MNALGPLRVVHALQPNLQQASSANSSGGNAGSSSGGGSSSSSSSSSSSGGSKVAIITSKMGSIAATREGGKIGSAGYR